MWYKSYYSDFSYSSLFKKISSFEKFLNKYFQYGIFYKNNLFTNKFWFKNIKNTASQNNTPLYFRKYYYSHQTLTIEHSYFIRLISPEFFSLKLYILRYNNWVIASIQWFKPLKPLRREGFNHKPNTRVATKTTPFSISGGSKSYRHVRTRLFHFFLTHSRVLYKNLQYRF